MHVARVVVTNAFDDESICSQHVPTYTHRHRQTHTQTDTHRHTQTHILHIYIIYTYTHTHTHTYTHNIHTSTQKHARLRRGRDTERSRDTERISQRLDIAGDYCDILTSRTPSRVVESGGRRGAFKGLVVPRQHLSLGFKVRV